MSHAYLFYGNDEAKKEEAVRALLAEFLCLPAGLSADKAGKADQEAEKSPDFFKIESAPITIEDVRAIKLKSSQKPLGEGKNVFFLKNIENLSREATPALLKIIEEPPSGSVIVATSANSRAIPLTIKSRFSMFRFFAKSAPAAHGGNEFEQKLKKALWEADGALRSSPSRNNILKLEKALRAYALSMDPTANKRLIGEYLEMLA